MNGEPGVRAVYNAAPSFSLVPDEYYAAGTGIGIDPAASIRGQTQERRTSLAEGKESPSIERSAGRRAMQLSLFAS